MKKLIIWIIVIFVFLNKINMTFSEGKTYCDGYLEGFNNGYCYRIVNCVKPVPPICPVAPVIFNTYKDGYSDGFLAGKKKRKNEGA